ncbi:fatty acid synthase subunit alpha reductase [Ilyonectria sp. MPI-CAGE-AT-0026]|nr:fatty acid synthase subunit alpha reductase [Ilyonectria sp. MPI-CAGE-AT-0026]
MRPEVEQQLAHTLLVELLAYQFASPVRWIETQDVFLAEKTAELVVEIGPADTLSVMAKRTLASKYEAYDAAKSVRRQILCYSKDAKEIYYEADPIEDDPEPASPSSAPAETSSSASAAATAAAATAATAPTPTPAPSTGPAVQVPDAPVQATDIVRALIAQKLKKPLNEVPLDKAIKDLVGGKSTLQNEIIGDLGKEFGSTPEKSEDTPLNELSASLQATFDGQLGKSTQSLIARMVSSKMPGGFNITVARKYLETRWGLASGRQDGALLLALTMEPAARLGAESDAKAFLDDVTRKYASNAGISLSTVAGVGPAAGSGGDMMIDPAAIDTLTKDQRVLFKQQLELLARYLKIDLRAGDKALISSKLSEKLLQSQIDLWSVEHGDFYASGIQPVFTPLKARIYDSSWNWARQDALHIYFDVIFGRLQVVDREIVSRCIRIMNRANPTLLEFMQYHIDNCPTERGETYKLAKELGEQLILNCKDVLDAPPVFKDAAVPTSPRTTVDAKGNLSYEEVQRPNCRKLEHYVQQMADGGKISEYGGRNKAQNDLKRIYKLIREQHNISKTSRLEIKNLYEGVLRSLSMNESQIIPKENGTPTGAKKVGANGSKGKIETIPFLHLKRKTLYGWEYSKKLTALYLDCLEEAAKDGITFQDKYVLMTGAGAGSIGAEVLQGLISGGAKVIVTTSRFSREVTEFYQAIYTKYGSYGSQVVVVPFNQGSKQDVEALIEYIYEPKTGLGWDLDLIIPFAAISENSRQIDSIDSKSELAHRIMLTNLVRLLGCVKTQKSKRGFETRPAQVVLPLSPNHGTFGNDGLYSESKLGLETLFNRWYSEDWANYLSICGAIIGWTRGTSLMAGNNVVAEGIEALGVRTFSQQEMAFNLLGLMSPPLVDLCQSEPIFADLNGGLQFIPNLNEILNSLRKNIMETSEVRYAVAKEIAIENKIVNGADSELLYKKKLIQPRANIKFDFPFLPNWKSEIAPLNDKLKGMVDLDKVVVVTGFGEVGPWGNSRTRWEMEAYGEFSLEGCVEMAWIMGLIKNHNGPIKGKIYSGWVDAKTDEPVNDQDIKKKYEQYILEHSGIRLVEPELFNGYDPNKKQLLHEIIIEEDLKPFEASKETAEEFKREHGDKVEIFEIPESGEYFVCLKKGAGLWIPKALRFDRLVAGQIPTGWDAKRYGIPEDIANQVDPVTLFTLVSVAEALISSGITDPYEFYQYVHVSEVGNCIGSGMGGASALRGMHRDRFLDKPVQNDIFQEAFINSMAAWVNMLLISSSGPIKTPVGACATSIESIDIGYETIMEGKAKIVLVGGLDDFGEEGSYEFANMKATSNAVDEFEHGRTPQEMSRPTATTRNGFMESQGCGVQILMTAQVALDMGVPIYGIIALSTTATDKIGRSIPAPGQGLLTTAREYVGQFPSPLLDINYRRHQIDLRKKQIKQWCESELESLQDEVEAIKAQGHKINEKEYAYNRSKYIEKEAIRQENDVLRSLGNNFWKSDPTIAPFRGALATWGLTVDDLDVASFHGTSTEVNDTNESSVIDQQLKHLGRKKGNAVLGIFQKYLTGHPKGAAGAWMMNGCLQVLNTGLVPGNRNADNVDPDMEQYDSILYPSRSLQTDGIKAFLVTSFGFGQKGAQAIGVHPKYLFATLDEQTYNAYRTKVEDRQKKAYRFFHDGIINNTLFVAKSNAPYTEEQLSQVLLNPHARVTQDKKTSSLTYPSNFMKLAEKPSEMQATEEMMKVLAQKVASKNSKVGVNVENIKAITVENETFINRNFTKEEIQYCLSAPNPQSSFTGRWSAKEAVFKSLGVASQGTGAAMKDIEVLKNKEGAPVVTLHGHAAAAAEKAGLKEVSVSISHSDTRAIAVAVAIF